MIVEIEMGMQVIGLIISALILYEIRVSNYR